MEDRQFDLALNAGVAIPFDDTYITPQIHLSYVTRDEDVVPDAGFSDSFIAWVGVHVGYNIGFPFRPRRPGSGCNCPSSSAAARH
ncbi:MAG: hypothetical protein RL685_1227 [Pseudomonadota bacterium]